MMALWNQYEVEEPEEPEEIPGVLKIDYKDGYNSPKRSRMLSQVESKVPHMLRFTKYLYAQRAKIVVMHKGVVVGEIASVHGSQQGHLLGGHLFALAIYGFMLKLKGTFPEACISWIVDDLTVSAKQGQLQELAEMVHTQGPDYGLFKHCTKREFFSQMSVIDPR